MGCSPRTIIENICPQGVTRSVMYFTSAWYAICLLYTSNIMETTVAKVHAAYLDGTLTCRELCEDYLARIKACLLYTSGTKYAHKALIGQQPRRRG